MGGNLRLPGTTTGANIARVPKPDVILLEDNMPPSLENGPFNITITSKIAF